MSKHAIRRLRRVSKLVQSACLPGFSAVYGDPEREAGLGVRKDPGARHERRRKCRHGGRGSRMRRRLRKSPRREGRKAPPRFKGSEPPPKGPRGPVAAKEARGRFLGVRWRLAYRLKPRGFRKLVAFVKRCGVKYDCRGLMAHISEELLRVRRHLDYEGPPLAGLWKGTYTMCIIRPPPRGPLFKVGIKGWARVFEALPPEPGASSGRAGPYKSAGERKQPDNPVPTSTEESNAARPPLKGLQICRKCGWAGKRGTHDKCVPLRPNAPRLSKEPYKIPKSFR